jgi:hypothetical protein
MALATTRLHSAYTVPRRPLLRVSAALVGAVLGVVFAQPVLAFGTGLWQGYLRPAFDELARSGFLSWCL